jgi:hypothetical protein
VLRDAELPPGLRHPHKGVPCPLAGRTVDVGFYCRLTSKPVQECCGRGHALPYRAPWMYHPPQRAAQETS